MNSANPSLRRKILAAQGKKKLGRMRGKKKPVAMNGESASYAAGEPRSSSSSSYTSSSSGTLSHSSGSSDIDSSSDDDNDEGQKGSDNEEQETPRDYRRGGYHPVQLGDTYCGRYHVLRKLGWGYFSTVWLAWDMTSRRFVGLKIVKSSENYTDTALDEIKLLRCIRDTDPFDPFRERNVMLYDDFRMSGVHGTHVCMVFEVLGHNLLKLIVKSDYKGIYLNNVRRIIRQVLEGLEYLHDKCKIIHTDIKPENVLVKVEESEVRRMAYVAYQRRKLELRMPISFISAAPSSVLDLLGMKMSKNRKKRMKKTGKRNEEREKEMEVMWKLHGTDAELREFYGPGIDVIRLKLYLEKRLKDTLQIELSTRRADSLTRAYLAARAPGATSDDYEMLKEALARCLPRHQIFGAECVDLDAVIELLRSAERNGQAAVCQVNGEAVASDCVEMPEEDGVENSGESCEDNANSVKCELVKSLEMAGDGAEVAKSSPESEMVQQDRVAQKCVPLGDQATEISSVKSETGVTEATVLPLEPGSPSESFVSCENLGIEAQLEDVAVGSDKKMDSDVDDHEQYSTPPEQFEVRASSLDPHVNESDGTSNESLSQSLSSLSLSKSSPESSESARGGDFSEEMVPGVDGDCDLSVKIVDVGNGCWTFQKFTDEIQTRQYRSLEVLVGSEYGCSADIWSTACMAFELATGDYLFEPKAGKNRTRAEDHLAIIIELLGPIPLHIARGGKYSRNYFTPDGQLRNIKRLQPWDLCSILRERYKWDETNAQVFADFLTRMLHYDPLKRARAAECLRHPFLNLQ
ncbi:unnamed protein product [Notodromas monacha]|uniref:non-specific serine/threonine protein kinase n=1 Tax=Notodromas monacha TaxID=399045 RepID=A0A7R9GHJ0_9CRUS|nr:unnamed protein product [Notodromas monacha]CAG0922958.1 unnamed protein product [Notodromas monacha]